MDEQLRRYLETDDGVLEARWKRLQSWLEERFGDEAGIETILFLIGIQAQGRGYRPKLKREKKQDLIMEGTFCAFEKIGLYEHVGMEEDGAWIWERTGPELPKLPVEDQEKLLRIAIITYFDDVLEDAAS